MNFNFPLPGSVRKILFPFSLIYYACVWCRNRLYDKNILSSASFNLPIICVGNLSVGGTGKSPMVEYLVSLLKEEVAVATLSRGYKRKTKGYALANRQSTALEIGDEPMLFHLKFPEVGVSVGEQRLEAIPQLLHDLPDTRVIILDDAFQHRAVKAGFNILLVDCNHLFTRDWYLPAGNLRDEKASYRRAHVIVVTKCSPGITAAEKKNTAKELAPLSHQRVFFSTIRYGNPYHILSKQTYAINKNTGILLVTGIANPGPLRKMLLQSVAIHRECSFSDHHIFTIDDLRKIITAFEALASPVKIILTTEKDAVRLVKFEQELKNLPFYVMPIKQEFLFNEGGQFNNLVKAFILNFKQSS